ncbi:hypothetical protein C6497_11440 [Candidatus Poribacteria bacterium]|nr:MAG: hypothetical protein C6497_11440 [Candidatus Poribacteria bacterium]
MKLMKDIHEKWYNIVTFSIISNTSWIRKYIDITQKNTVRCSGNPCSEMPLTVNQQPTTNCYKLIIANINITNVKIQHKN